MLQARLPRGCEAAVEQVNQLIKNRPFPDGFLIMNAKIQVYIRL